MRIEHFKKVQEIANNISSCIKSLKLYQPDHINFLKWKHFTVFLKETH